MMGDEVFGHGVRLSFRERCRVESSKPPSACPHCGNKLRLLADSLGTEVRCPKCNTKFIVVGTAAPGTAAGGTAAGGTAKPRTGPPASKSAGAAPVTFANVPRPASQATELPHLNRAVPPEEPDDPSLKIPLPLAGSDQRLCPVIRPTMTTPTNRSPAGSVEHWTFGA